MLPGSVFNRELLIRSYQNISNLGFFQQPMPPPDVAPDRERPGRGHHLPGDREADRQRQFRRVGGAGHRARRLPRPRGAQPLRPRQARQVPVAVRPEHQRLQPALHRPVHPGEPDLGHHHALQFPAALHRRRPRPAAAGAAARSRSASRCSARATPGSSPPTACSRSATPAARRPAAALQLRPVHPVHRRAVSLVRDTRDRPAVRRPAAPGRRPTCEFNGGILGGDGDYQKIEYRGQLVRAAGQPGRDPAARRAACSSCSGSPPSRDSIFGDAGPFFTELYSMGGVQYGIPLRGYEEFSITPDGYDPSANSSRGEPQLVRQVLRRRSRRRSAPGSASRCTSTCSSTPATCTGRRAVQPQPALPRRRRRGSVDFPARPDRDRPGLRHRPGEHRGPAAPGWKLHFKLGNFF